MRIGFLKIPICCPKERLFHLFVGICYPLATGIF
jgi:hypothetical protein